MKPDTAPGNVDEPEVLCSWSARRMRPVVLLYVVAVFGACVLLAHFVFHSSPAVTALVLAAVGAVVPLVSAALARVEYRFTEQGLESRPLGRQGSKAFGVLFVTAELTGIVPLRHGFKYYEDPGTGSRFKRFWRVHGSGAFSGEVHVDPADRQRVIDALTRQGVTIR